MKRIFTAGILVIMAVLLAVGCGNSGTYAKKCYSSDQASFDQLAEEFRSVCEPGLESARFSGELELSYTSADTKYVQNEKITGLLDDLRSRYGGDSDLPVFESASAEYDKDGNMTFRVVVRREKIRDNSIEGKDVRYEELILADPGHENSLVLKNVGIKPFSGDWYVNSGTTYSG